VTAATLSVIVSVLFAGAMALRYARRHRPYQLVWTLGLAMFAVAALAGVLARIGGATETEYRVFYLFGAILNVAGLMWACGVAMRLRTLQAGPIMQMPVFLALFVAPVYVPLSLLRGWIHGVAVVNPLTRLLEAGRSLLAGTPSEVGFAFLAAAALAALFTIWALRGLRKAEAAG